MEEDVEYTRVLLVRGQSVEVKSLGRLERKRKKKKKKWESRPGLYNF